MRVSVHLKPLRDQTLVITGASSGIGLATACLAAKRGARVVLNSNNHTELDEALGMVRATGGEAAAFRADVADADAMRALAQFAIRRYGGFDTWINNAGIHLFGKLAENEPVDMRRIFDVNYWGVVNGCRAALPHLRLRGGALINIGSVLSSRSVPLQGIYGATKHAVQGYSDALRMELEKDGAPVVVTVIRPAAIATPIPAHSKNIMADRAQLPPPLYAPEVAARGILFCAEHPRRSFTIGVVGLAAELGEKFLPALSDKLLEQFMWNMQKAKGPPRESDALHTRMNRHARTESAKGRFVLRHSVYNSVLMHPYAAGGLLAATAGAGVGAAALRQRKRNRQERVHGSA